MFTVYQLHSYSFNVGASLCKRLFELKYSNCYLYYSYNSAVFSTLASNAYSIVVVPPNMSFLGTANASFKARYEGLVGTEFANIQSMYSEK